MFIEAKDDGGDGDNWTTGAISRAKLQSDHHHQQTNIQFFTGRMPFLSANQQCQSTEGKISHSMDLLTPSSPAGLPILSLTTNSSWLSWGWVAMPLISPLMRVKFISYKFYPTLSWGWTEIWGAIAAAAPTLDRHCEYRYGKSVCEVSGDNRRAELTRRRRLELIGDVNCVADDTVPRWFCTDHARYHRTYIQAYF